MMKTKVLSSVVIAAGLLFGATSLSYADSKTYPASECVRWDERVDPVTFLNFGRRFNPSTTLRLRLDCPAVKDRSTDVRNSWIRVIDQHPNDQVCAQFIAYKQLGALTVIRGTPQLCTTLAFVSATPVQLNTGALAAIPADAHYYFSVLRIPMNFNGAVSGVVTYAVDEVDFE
ncbi:MAG: hypothetical protein HOP18_02685 [Deltaproteobacteria bacterium]|nr:hypothetical protein [Deltaproteobacteria bacterium]